jgi:antibiotic biosynthesis monooxygenase (ABM) superfamily enzyme
LPIFPLTIVIPWVLQPLFAVPGVSDAAIIVGLMTYVVMPPHARLVSRWLYSEHLDRIDSAQQNSAP